jgi:trehalose 6-phosphate synthase
LGRLIVVSNRVPPPRERNQLAGGLAIGLKEALKDQDAMWFGWSGASNADEDEPRKVTIAKNANVTFATIDMTGREFAGFYQGFSNGILWPLLHYRVGLMEYKRDDLETYLAVNELFAEHLAPLLDQDDIIWVHDYHLFPLGEALRRRGIANRIGFFLHIPFPPPALFYALPGGAQLVRSMAAYDLIGVQTDQDRDQLNQALADEDVERRAETFPIGIDPDEFNSQARRALRKAEARRMIESMGTRALILGVDRLDYSKGIPERFRGFANLLHRFPTHRNKVTFLQVAPVSRGDVPEYRALRRALDELAGRINGEHAEFDWIPLRYLTRSMARGILAGFHRIARVGLVTPLRDGMNLVAKEYVAAQDEEDPGVLILSRFAGAAASMPGALLVNPHDPDEIAEALDQALRLSLKERQTRWRTMRDAVWHDTAAAWARRFLAALRDQDHLVTADSEE